MQLQNDLITLLGQIFRTIDFILTEPNIYHKNMLNFGFDADISRKIAAVSGGKKDFGIVTLIPI